MRIVSEGEREPCEAELAEIEAEWPVIEADLAVVDRMARMARAGYLSELDWKALRLHCAERAAGSGGAA